MDVLHRVLAVTGLEVELSASPHALAARRRETLSNFLDVAASFAAGDGEATLLAFLGFLRTAAQYEKGLDNALPGGENTVKVLTAHKSKGLEWDVVVVPGLVTGTFPSGQGREKWTAQGKVLPHELRGDADTLPEIATWDAKGIKAFHEAMKDHQHTEELRLGYVTFTRPARSCSVPVTGGASQKKPRGPRTSWTPSTSTAPPDTARSRSGPRSPPRTRRTPPCARRPPTARGRSRSTTRHWPAAAPPPRPFSPTWSAWRPTKSPTPGRREPGTRPTTTPPRTTIRTGHPARGRRSRVRRRALRGRRLPRRRLPRRGRLDWDSWSADRPEDRPTRPAQDRPTIPHQAPAPGLASTLRNRTLRNRTLRNPRTSPRRRPAPSPPGTATSTP